MFTKTLLLSIFLSFILSSDIEETNLDIYANCIISFFNNDSTKNNIFYDFEKKHVKFKDVNIYIPMFTENSPVELILSKNNNSKKILIKNNIENFREKLFMVLCINSFLSGSLGFSFNEKELHSGYDNSQLKKKINMLNHFNDNYMSLKRGQTTLVTINDGHFFINKYKGEIILLCLNYSDSKQEYSLDLSNYDISVGLSLLDRSMIKVSDKIAQINLSSYQTKIFNLKR